MRWKSRWDQQYKWHRYFAWFPVLIDGEYIWLEWVERKRVSELGCVYYKYRLINK